MSDATARKKPAHKKVVSAKDLGERRLREMDGLIPLLPALPLISEAAIEPFPGELEGTPGEQIFVRRTEVFEPTATRAVYVHGLGGSSVNWTDLMYLLGPTLPGIAMDLPGFGYSDPPSGHVYTISRHAEAVIETIEHENTGPVHLFGNSMGGAVAIRVAAERPDLVCTLTLISPALPNQRLLPTHLQIAAQGVPIIPRMLGFHHSSMKSEDRARLMFEWCYGDLGRLRHDRFQAAIIEVDRRGDLGHSMQAFVASSRGIAQTFVPFSSKNTWRLAKQIKAPTLAVFGAKDRLVDYRVATRIGSTFKDSLTVIMGDVGHVAQMEAPERVATMLLQRLAELGERYT